VDIDRLRDGLPDKNVVEGGLAVVQVQDGVSSTNRFVTLEGIHGGHGVQVVRAHICIEKDAFGFAAHYAGHGGGGVREEPQLDLGQGWAAKIVLIAGTHKSMRTIEAGELVWAGADRILVERASR